MMPENPATKTTRNNTHSVPPNCRCEQLAQVVVVKKADKSKHVKKHAPYSDKKEYDKFYTKESVAIDCLKSLNLDDYDFVIEPSAGSGSFFRNIDHENKVGLDIKPECCSINEQDWFRYKIDKRFKRVLIVGNPPFGINNQLSKAFIKHASSFDAVKTIAFILPDAYNKHTSQRHVPLEFRLKYSKKLPRNSFEINGIPYNAPCTFFIFDKSFGVDLRFQPENYKDTKDFIFGTKADYDFFVLGAAPHRVSNSPTPKNRGYYIRARESVDVERVKENFKRCPWTGNGSAPGGAAWLLKEEIVCQYRKQFEDGCG